MVAVWPTPVLRVAGGGAGISTRTVRNIASSVAVLVLATALLIGP